MMQVSLPCGFHARGGGLSARRRGAAAGFRRGAGVEYARIRPDRTWISSVYSASRDIASQYRKFLFANPA